jgi:magnesium-dependent phosphatase 1
VLVFLPFLQYELWGGGAPFAGDGTGTMKDRSGETVRLLGSVREILTELKHNPDWADTKVAWVSCTDEPSWAEELLGKFKLNSGEPIGTVIHSSQIYKANKTTHFRNLQKEFPDIAFEDMLFYDNEMGNIRSVSTLGVKCVYCPRGVTADAWSEGMKQFK